MSKKHFSFHYNHKTKKGIMKLCDKYIKISFDKKDFTPLCSSRSSSSGIGGYGLDLIWRQK